MHNTCHPVRSVGGFWPSNCMTFPIPPIFPHLSQGKVPQQSTHVCTAFLLPPAGKAAANTQHNPSDQHEPCQAGFITNVLHNVHHNLSAATCSRAQQWQSRKHPPWLWKQARPQATPTGGAAAAGDNLPLLQHLAKLGPSLSATRG